MYKKKKKKSTRNKTTQLTLNLIPQFQKLNGLMSLTIRKVRNYPISTNTER